MSLSQVRLQWTKCHIQQPTCHWDLGGPRKKKEALKQGSTCPWDVEEIQREASWDMSLTCPKGLGEQSKGSPSPWVSCSNNPHIHHLPMSYFTPWPASPKKSRSWLKTPKVNTWKPIKMHVQVCTAGPETLKKVTSFQNKFLRKLSFLEGERQRHGEINTCTLRATAGHGYRYKVMRCLLRSRTWDSSLLLATR